MGAAAISGDLVGHGGLLWRIETNKLSLPTILDMSIIDAYSKSQ
jgi:hypothetical protein